MNKEITDKMLDCLRKRVRAYLTEKRYAHTLSVEVQAGELAKIFLPEEEYRLRAAALLHDITKRLNLEKQLQLCQNFGIIISNGETKVPKLLHAKTAVAVVRQDFPEFADSRVLSGIRWHTTGRAGMTLFESIVYLADYIESTRTFDDCVRLRQFFYEKISETKSFSDKMEVLRQTMVLSFDLTIRVLIEEKMLIDRDTIEARNWFLSPAL